MKSAMRREWALTGQLCRMLFLLAHLPLFTGYRITVVVPGFVGRVGLARQALRARPFDATARANGSGPERVPGGAARGNTEPSVFSTGPPLALGAIDLDFFHLAFFSYFKLATGFICLDQGIKTLQLLSQLGLALKDINPMSHQIELGFSPDFPPSHDFFKACRLKAQELGILQHDRVMQRF